jgi:hypothetical protein
MDGKGIEGWLFEELLDEGTRSRAVAPPLDEAFERLEATVGVHEKQRQAPRSRELLLVPAQILRKA